jgi:hypothetical protein
MVRTLLLPQELKRYRFDGFGAGIAHQSGHVGHPQTPMFNTAKAIMKHFMKTDQFLGNVLDIVC